MKNRNLVWLWVSMVILTLIRLYMAAWVPLAPDEAYYWIWSKNLALSFYDHPPMIALWIKAGCLIGGDTALGVRLLAPFSALLGSIFVFFATRDFDPDPSSGQKHAIQAVFLLNATLAVGVGSITITPDTPLLFFICMFLWACGRLIRTNKTYWWLMIGISGGLALLSKYTALLMLAGLGIWCFLTPAGRQFLKGKALWGGAILTCGIFSPVLIWNAHHQWISFLKQGGRTGDWHPQRALQFLSELVGGQVGLATPLVFLCFCMGFLTLSRQLFQKREKAALFLWLLIILPVCIFIQHAIGDRVQANWVGILYPVLAVIAGIYGRHLFKSAVILGSICILAVYLQAVFALFPLPAKLDITLKRLGGWQELVQQVDMQVPVLQPIIADDYGLASELAFYGKSHPVVAVGSRWGYFSMPEYEKSDCSMPDKASKEEYLIRTQRRQDWPSSDYFSDVRKIGVVVRKRKQAVAETYDLYQVRLNETAVRKKEVACLSPSS